jgi:hypothetical protein
MAKKPEPIHKLVIKKLRALHNRCLRMIGKYPRAANVNFFSAEFSVLKSDYYPQLLISGM